jgi:Xaa-Pro dipeptidase
MFDLSAIQQALLSFQLDGWLLCDFRGNNLPALRILGMPDGFRASRRFFYFIPAVGTPVKLVHRIETGVLSNLPGDTLIYLKWQELEQGLRSMVSGMSQVAMEYSPKNANPYISRVDAGTVELVRSFGADVVSSGDLISQFESTLSAEQLQSHLAASELTAAAYDKAWKFIADQVRRAGGVDEMAVCDVILQHFADHQMVTSHSPIVAVGPNSGNPHYETGTGSNTWITRDSFVLIDLWAKLDQPEAVYSDLTRTGFVGTEVPEYYSKVFQIVADARDAGIRCVQEAFEADIPLLGWQVDQATRAVIEAAGYGADFCHRTGHNLGQETHGNGTHMDNLETHETRRILPRTLFTIEPGIYLPTFGIRSEINVYIHESQGEPLSDGAPGQDRVQVTGLPIQREIVAILREY